MATYYVLKKQFGKKKCIAKSASDDFGDKISTKCGEFYTFPTNVKYIRKISVSCTDNGAIEADVYVDWYTAVRILNL